MGMFGIVVGAITTVAGIVKDDEEMVKEAVGVLSRRMKYHDEPEGVQYVQELSQIK